MTGTRIPNERLDAIESKESALHMSVIEQRELVRGYRAATESDLERVAAIDALAALKRASDAEIAALRAGIQLIAGLRYSEAGEPFDEALDIADALLTDHLPPDGETM